MSRDSKETGFEVAIIGISCRFPGAPDVLAFWNNLKDGIDSIAFFSVDELGDAGIDSGALNHPNYVKANGMLEGIEYFDSTFFGYSPKEAEVIDPQIRIFHECAWTALEDAGYDANRYDGLIGLYAGASPSFDWEALSLVSGKTNQFGGFATVQLTNKDFISTRISYKLNLTGPSLSMYTACSTSLVAVHLASQAVINGECDMALAGGITISILNKRGYMYQEGMIASPDGHCRAFDAGARGTVSGDGVGIVVIKRLEDARSHRDYIYALIKGSAINNDGLRKVGFSAPSIEGQAEVIKTAMQMAEVEPERISYIEAHGTGTELGDPVEIEALKLAFDSKKKGFCAIGSVKTNVGHLDSAAGVAGLIKAVLALKFRLIPPSLYYEKPNPKIDFKGSPFYVNTKLIEWKSELFPLRAGISSFGIGGTNAHVILEEFPVESNKEVSRRSRPQKLLLLSAQTKDALERVTRNLVEYFIANEESDLDDVAYTLQAGRNIFSHRKMMVCTDVREAINVLSSPQSPQIQTFFSKNLRQNNQIVFMFPGQGSQYVNMGLELYRTEDVFRKEMDRCFNILASISDLEFKRILYPQDATNDTGADNSAFPATSSEILSPVEIIRTEIAQPLLFIIEYALSMLLMKWGLRPTVMIGHSIGEYVAAHISGVLSLEDALKMVLFRGKLMQKMPEGSMLSVPLPEEILLKLLDDGISLAAVNSSSLCVVSGSDEEIERFSEKLNRMGYDTTRLNTSHAFHSEMMDPILDEFEEQVSRIPLGKTGVPYISNVTGTWVNPRDLEEPRYWVKHLRGTIRFADGLKELLKDEDSIFLEVGPGRMLSTFVKRHEGRGSDQFTIDFIRHPKEKASDSRYLLQKIGQLWLYGENIDWQEFYCGEYRHRVPLPTYPFERQPYPVSGDPLKIAKKLLFNEVRAGGKLAIADWFYFPTWEPSKLSPVKIDNPGEKGEQRFLMIMENKGLAEQLGKSLEQEGHEVIVVRPGLKSLKVNDDLYELNPGEQGGYDHLFSEIISQGWIPDKIIHLLSVTEDIENTSTNEELAKAKESGFLSLIFLAKAIGQCNFKRTIQIDVVSSNMQAVTGEEALCPEKSLLIGAVKVIPQEYPNIVCRSIDVVIPSAGSWQERKLTEQLLNEFIQVSGDSIVAYRVNRRYVNSFKPVRFEETLESVSTLKKGGVYLITGGLGELGYVLARFLARHSKAKLVLTGRSILPERERWQEWLSTNGESESISQKIMKVYRLEELGAEVLVLTADIADQLQMAEVVDRAKRQFGKINGVIHAAGFTDPEGFRFIHELDKELCESHFKPKVHGLYVLENVLSGEELDFCLLTSSLASVLGGLRYAAYSAANIFMDSFVHHHNLKNRFQWTSVNWDGWQFIENGQPGGEGAGVEMAIIPGEGEKAFQRILSWGEEGQIVISTHDLQNRINRWIKFDFLKEVNDSNRKDISVTQARPELLTTYAPPENQIELEIANILKNYFGFEKVGRHDNFFDLGATSLDIIQLNRKLREDLGQDISVVSWFEYSTVSTLAIYLNRQSRGDEISSESSRIEKVTRGLSNLEEMRKRKAQIADNKSNMSE